MSRKPFFDPEFLHEVLAELRDGEHVTVHAPTKKAMKEIDDWMDKLAQDEDSAPLLKRLTIARSSPTFP